MKETTHIHSLVLHCGIPPTVHQEDPAGFREIESDSSGFEGDQEDGHVGRVHEAFDGSLSSWREEEEEESVSEVNAKRDEGRGRLEVEKREREAPAPARGRRLPSLFVCDKESERRQEN